MKNDDELLKSLGTGSLDDTIKELNRQVENLKFFDLKYYNVERLQAIKKIKSELNEMYRYL